MSLDSNPSITTIHIHPPASQKVTSEGPLPWLNSDKTDASSGKQTAADTSWGGDGFGFDDFIDIVNPLHHLPVIGDLYREYTGDKIATEASLIGGGLIGGPVGFAASAINAVAEETTGDTVMGHLASLFVSDAPEATQLATQAPTALMANNLPPAPKFASASEILQPLDFGPVDGKADPGLPPSLPADTTVLSLFAPELSNARADYNAAQGVLLAQEIESELDG